MTKITINDYEQENQRLLLNCHKLNKELMEYKVRVKEAIRKNVKLSPKGFYVIQLEQFKEDLGME